MNAEHGKRLQFIKFNHKKIGKEILACSLTISVAEEGKIIPSDKPDIVGVPVH